MHQLKQIAIDNHFSQVLCLTKIRQTETNGLSVSDSIPRKKCATKKEQENLSAPTALPGNHNGFLDGFPEKGSNDRDCSEIPEEAGSR
jgi:hypothetical protein